jgi:hypothetical protein
MQTWRLGSRPSFGVQSVSFRFALFRYGVIAGTECMNWEEMQDKGVRQSGLVH